MSVSKADILLVGCGKMGSALLAGWLKSDLVRHVYIVEPNGVALSGPDNRVSVFSDISLSPNDLNPDMAIFAVKPQLMAKVVPAYAGFAQTGTTFLSIAAGQTLATFATLLGADAAIIRSMPNTPAAVGRGITVAVANKRVEQAGKTLATRLLEAVGIVDWVDDEALLDAVTALSGGGPAYVFLLIEVLAEAGIKSGLPADLAMRLARETVCGSGELARLSSEPADQLRRNVTSPNGTTFEALSVLMGENGIQRPFDEAIAMATKRSRELAG